jgi:hypothetical protein
MNRSSARKHAMRIPEVLLISLVWIALIASPYLFGERDNKADWHRLLNPLEMLIPLSVAFLVNRFILVPLILFRNEKSRYILSTAMLITAVTVITFFIFEFNHRKRPPPPLPPDMSAPSARPPSDQQQPVPPYVNVLIFSILLVGFDTGLRMSVRLAESEQEKALLEKEHMRTQLTLLRNQVSPHFFMNTLNNIHSLIDLDASGAKEAVIRLSSLMRYLLYESGEGTTSLKNELAFIKSYIDLMKLRFTENVQISVHLPDRIPDKQVPPFLLTPFIENAFKHGISYKEKSYIAVEVALDDRRLILIVKNSIAREVKKDPLSGIGIENSRKRLDLLYGSAYHLDLLSDGQEFRVNLSIPV